MLTISEDISLSLRKIKSIKDDPQKSAEAVNLVYVNDQQPGIHRIRKDDQFHYLCGKKKLRDKKTLERIKKLAIPPAWEEVWICSIDNGHLQATGFDVKKRKQYRYHPLWNSLRNHTKFYRLHEFGKSIPLIRQQVEKDLSLKGLPVEKVLAAVVCLMEQTSIRVGNNLYEKLNGSFGITTLKDKHVKISGDKMQFIFKGKKGVSHNVSLKSKRLAKIVKACRDIPGKELFQYYDHDGNHKCIDSGMVNNYLKSITGKDFTAKDFRTWSGTVHSLIAFKEITICSTLENNAEDNAKASIKDRNNDNRKDWRKHSRKKIAEENDSQTAANITLAQASSSTTNNTLTKAEIKSHILLVLDHVAAHLGNTRTVCKKYYVHPAIIELYENCRLHPYLNQLDDNETNHADDQLTCEERLLMTILEKEGLSCG